MRALPPAALALAARGGGSLGPELCLDLGRALSVELRRTPGGVEVVLLPDAGLSRAAAGELPAIVRALRERGVEVARARVRARARPR